MEKPHHGTPAITAQAMLIATKLLPFLAAPKSNVIPPRTTRSLTAQRIAGSLGKSLRCQRRKRSPATPHLQLESAIVATPTVTSLEVRSGYGRAAPFAKAPKITARTASRPRFAINPL